MCDFIIRFMDSKLSAYKGSTMLELTIWKSKIVEQTDGGIYPLDADLKMACQIDSLTMVVNVIPNVMCSSIIYCLNSLTAMGSGGNKKLPPRRILQ